MSLKGPSVFLAKGVRCRRHDTQLVNSRGHRLECSFFEPQGLPTSSGIDCVVYLHCFNGSRLESLKFADAILQRGCGFCCFDFSGSGLSGGDFVSLGFYEQQDVVAVIGHIREKFAVANVALWGRSMGGVTAMLYASK